MISNHLLYQLKMVSNNNNQWKSNNKNSNKLRINNQLMLMMFKLLFKIN